MMDKFQLRGFTLMLLALLSPCLAAQIFPHIEKPDVQRRAGVQPSEAPKPPAAAPVEETIPDSEAAHERFSELLEKFSRDNAVFRDIQAKQLSRIHPSIRDYITGIILLRLGQYNDAERRLRAVGHSVTREGETQPEAVQQEITRIRRGDAYLYRIAAATMRHWTTEDDAVERALQRAQRDAEGIIRELRNHAQAGRILDGDAILNAANNWLEAMPERWAARRTAEVEARHNLGEALAWRELAAATSGERPSDTFTPNYLMQRAALMVLKEFWPDDPQVTGGFADLELGRNHQLALQLDEWEAFFEPQPYHSEGGERTLAAGKIQAQSRADWLGSLKVE